MFINSSDNYFLTLNVFLLHAFIFLGRKEAFTCHDTHVEVRGQLSGASSLLLPHEFQVGGGHPYPLSHQVSLSYSVAVVCGTEAEPGLYLKCRVNAGTNG